MSMVGFPLLLIPLAVYNIIALLMPSVSFGDTLFKVPLVSGAQWPVTLSDILLALGVLLLLLEVIKAARPGAKYLTDHLLSLVVFGCAAAEFVMWPKFGTSTYFLLTLLSMTDFLTGIALRTRRAVPPAQNRVQRPAPPSAPGGPLQPAPRAEPPAAADELAPVPAPVPAAEPVPEPSPPPAAPVVLEPAPASASAPIIPARSAASVAESVLLDPPAPKSTQPLAAAREPSPAEPVAAGSEVSPNGALPELQPDGHAPASPEPPRD